MGQLSGHFGCSKIQQHFHFNYSAFSNPLLLKRMTKNAFFKNFWIFVVKRLSFYSSLSSSDYKTLRNQIIFSQYIEGVNSCKERHCRTPSSIFLLGAPLTSDAVLLLLNRL